MNLTYIIGVISAVIVVMLGMITKIDIRMDSVFP